MELRGSDFLMPRESAAYIMQNPQYVTINPNGIESVSNEVWKAWQENRLSTGYSQYVLHPNSDNPNAIEWIFILDTLNFCFWTPENQKTYTVQGYSGYFALCAAIKRAIQSKGIPITDAKFYSTISKEQLMEILKSDDGITEIPLLRWRLHCLHQVGRVLIENWKGQFQNMVKAADGSAVKLLQIIWRNFPCFRDSAVYNGNQKVTFLKRAQILVADIWSCYDGKDLGYFKDIDRITMFADYRVPQVLVFFGVLSYSDELMRTLILEKNISNGDPMEMEIRAASIHAVEQIKANIMKRLKDSKMQSTITTNEDETKEPANRSLCNIRKTPNSNINSILIDYFLWDYGRLHAKDMQHIPFHKVQTIFY